MLGKSNYYPMQLKYSHEKNANNVRIRRKRN